MVCIVALLRWHCDTNQMPFYVQYCCISHHLVLPGYSLLFI